MPERAARAYLRDLPDAELPTPWRPLGAGDNLDEIVALARDFLGRVHG